MYNKDRSPSRIHLVIFTWTKPEKVRGQPLTSRPLRMKQSGAVASTPHPTLHTHMHTHTTHPFCPESTQRLLLDLSGQGFGRTCRAATPVLNLVEVATIDQSRDKESGSSSPICFCVEGTGHSSSLLSSII